MWFNSLKKKKVHEYDSERLVPVIRASICNGEQVAGFKDKVSGEFYEEMLITSPGDLEDFKSKYGLSDIRKEY